MSQKSPRHTIPGSDREPVQGAIAVGDCHPDERLEVTLRLRPKAPLEDRAAHDEMAPLQRTYLTREEFASRHGADAKDIAAVEAFAKAHGLVVVDTSVGRRSVVLSGTASTLC